MLIEDVIRDWYQMDGATFLDKQVNALLTARMIQRHEIPGNECISYVAPLDALWDPEQPDESLARVTEFLLKAFGDWGGRARQTAELYARLRAGEFLSSLDDAPIPGS